MKKSNKIFSLLLSILVVLTCLTVSFVRAEATEYTETEDNGSYATANVITANSIVNGVIGSYDDVDYYKFTPTSNGIMTTVFNHTYFYDYNKWSITIIIYENGAYSSIDGKVVGRSDNESVEILKLGVKKGVTYFIRVAPNVNIHTGRTSNVNGITYSLDCKFQSSNNYEIERNETYNEANAIQIGNAISGNIFAYDAKNTAKTDVDMFKFTATKDGTIKVNFKHTYISGTTQNFWSVSINTYEDYTYKAIESYTVAVYDKENIDLGQHKVKTGQVYYIIISAKGSAVEKEYTFSVSYINETTAKPETTTKVETTTKPETTTMKTPEITNPDVTVDKLTETSSETTDLIIIVEPETKDNIENGKHTEETTKKNDSNSSDEKNSVNNRFVIIILILIFIIVTISIIRFCVVKKKK